jgi:hypothetical protein
VPFSTSAPRSERDQAAHEAISLRRGLIERISISRAEDGLEIELIGEIAKMVELGNGSRTKRASLDEQTTRSVKVVAGAGFNRALPQLLTLNPLFPGVFGPSA